MNGSQQVAMAQGMYFAATGVWPLVHMRSFEAVTGPKVDTWLVRTVGLLVAIVGGVLVSAAARNRITGEVAALGAATAAGLGAIDALYASKGRISPIYLADAALEAAIIASWAAAAPLTSRSPSRASLRRAARPPGVPDLAL
jgi:hypothetical protein